MKRLIPICATALLLMQACTAMQVRNAQTGAWVPIQGGTLEIHRDVEIGAGRARTFFQDGVPAHGINEFKPFCQIEVSTLRETAQTIQPDSFAVTPVGGRFEQVVERLPVQVAGLFIGVGSGGSMSGSDGPSRVSHVLYFRLHSPKQPDVRGFACGGAFDDPGNADAPTLQDIANALGAYATFTPR